MALNLKTLVKRWIYGGFLLFTNRFGTRLRKSNDKLKSATMKRVTNQVDLPTHYRWPLIVRV